LKSIVKSQDWPVTVMPDATAEAALDRKVSEREYRSLIDGFRPQEMDERWFMYVEEDWIYLHRSWTGFCIFKAKLEIQMDGYTITMLCINRNPDQYKSTNIEADINEFHSVLNSLITKILENQSNC